MWDDMSHIIEQPLYNQLSNKEPGLFGEGGSSDYEKNDTHKRALHANEPAKKTGAIIILRRSEIPRLQRGDL